MPAATLDCVALAEFRLAAACCRWPPDAARRATIRQAATGPIDWDRFHRIARRHHIEGLVWRGLSSVDIAVPDPIRVRFVDAAAKIVRRNLMAAAECDRIQRAFDAQDIPIAFLKGALVGTAAYGDLGLKYSWDIDVVVEPQAIEHAAAILEALGYHPVPPLPLSDPAVFRHWVKYGQEFILRNAAKNTHLELHWRLVNNDMVLQGVSPSADTQRVTITSGIALATFSDDVHLIYLCVHGARHSWTRLKWLVDVNALFARMDEVALRRLLDLARSYNADPAVAQAVTLCAALFDLAPAKDLAHKLLRKRRHRWLKHLALRYLAAGSGEHDIQWGRFGQLRSFLSRYLLGHGVRYRLNELKMQLYAPYDLSGRGAIFADTLFYPIHRVLVWLVRLGRKRQVPGFQ